MSQSDRKQINQAAAAVQRKKYVNTRTANVNAASPAPINDFRVLVLVKAIQTTAHKTKKKGNPIAG